MEKQVISTSESPRITIDVKGSLVLKGSFENEVVAKTGDPEDLSLEFDDDEVQVRCAGDCILQVPRAAKIEALSARGDTVIKGLDSQLTINEAHGNLTLRDVGPLTIERVRGELLAKHIEGDLSIREVSGNAVIRDLEGALVVEDSVRGNLKLDDVEGNVSVQVRGNATLRFDPVVGQELDISANGNIVCRIPQDASLKVHVEKAGDLKVNLRGMGLTGTQKTPFELTLGDGDAELMMRGRGNVILTTQAPDWEMMDEFDADFGNEIEGMAESISQQVIQQVESQMEMLESQMAAQLENLSISLSSSGLSQEAAERISQRAREASARATARAQEKMRRAQEKVQRKVEAAQRRAEQKARAASRAGQARERRSWGFEWPSSSAQNEPASTPVSDEERLLVLKMLEEGKISPEEAEQLLEALEGKQE